MQTPWFEKMNVPVMDNSIIGDGQNIHKHKHAMLSFFTHVDHIKHTQIFQGTFQDIKRKIKVVSRDRPQVMLLTVHGTGDVMHTLAKLPATVCSFSLAAALFCGRPSTEM